MDSQINKGNYVSDIKDANQEVRGVFLVEEKSLLETKNGDPYVAMSLSDKTGRIAARIWDGAVAAFNSFDAGDYIFIKGISQAFKSQIQLRVLSVKSLEKSLIDIKDFLPHTKFSIDAMWDEFGRILKSIKDRELHDLLKAIFEDKTIQDEFKRAPAAKRMHHAYIGGLLEHTLSVAKLAKMISRYYPWLDSDLLLCGALLHDIGKIEEFSYDAPPIDYTDKGRLLGHLVIGTNIIERFLTLTCMDKEGQKAKLLLHMILSHHGHKEFGSPVLPMTEEALVLHLIDDLDAKLNFLQGLKEENPTDDYNWTKYQSLLERSFFLPGIREELLEGLFRGQSEVKEHDFKAQDIGQKALWEK